MYKGVRTGFWGVTVLCSLLVGCGGDASEKATSFMVINVLDKALYDDCHIKHSINVPFGQFEKTMGSVPRTTRVVVYCSDYMCAASKVGVQKLQKMGFEQVWAYEAGMAEWFRRGLPVEGPCTQSYLHADNARPGHQEKTVPEITTSELKEKMSQFFPGTQRAGGIAKR